MSFLIPTITLGTAFGIYSSMKKKEIDALSAQALATKMYVFSGDLPVNHIVTKENIKLVDVKVASAPEGAFTEEESGDLIGKKLRIATQDKTIPIETMFFTEDDNIEIDNTYNCYKERLYMKTNIKEDQLLLFSFQIFWRVFLLFLFLKQLSK